MAAQEELACERPAAVKRRRPTEPTGGYVDGFTLLAAGANSALSIAAVDEKRLKEVLTQELLQFKVGRDMEEPILPLLPLTGSFQRGVEEYTQLWEQVIICEMKAQAASSSTAPAGAGRGAIAAEPMQNDPQGRWLLRLLVGEWVDTRERGRRFFISEPAPGRLQISDGNGSAAALGTPGPGHWRNAELAGGRKVQVRLKDWNVLEIAGSGIMKRAFSEVRPGTMVLMGNESGSRIGIAQPLQDNVAVRLGEELSGSHAFARVLNVSLTSSSRELCAVHGAKQMPSSLLEELLGKPPAAPEEWKPLVPEGKAAPPCLEKLNSSQLRAVEAVYNRQAGFGLIWGPPGTGKSATLLSLINALHLWEYEQLHRAIERIVLEPGGARGDNSRWAKAVRCAPRLLVTASSNAAVEGLIERVLAKKFLDRQGNAYEPWGMLRVGAERGSAPWMEEIDLDRRVHALMMVPTKMVEERLAQVQAALHALHTEVLRLRADLERLHSAMPLPLGWEARLSKAGPDVLEFHDHKNRKATWQRPEPPPAGAPRLRLLQQPQAVERLGVLIRCADKWWQLSAEEQRLKWLTERVHGSAGDKVLRERLEASLLGNAHIVFATLNSAARMRQHADKQTPFGVIVVDEAAQATEPSVLVPLELARSKRCVLVGDDRQLPPTIFSSPSAEGAALAARTLFERLRQLGHKAQLLEEQYRMAPEISAFPCSYFYGGALRDAAGMRERTRRRLHEVFPPLLFLHLEASAGRKTGAGSWENVPEAQFCARLLARVREVAEEQGEAEVAANVGILTPYKAQQDALRREVQRQGLPLEASAVQTVDAFQGRECEVIVFSAVRAPDAIRSGGVGLGFLADERRLNVALTRAKSLLLIVGHAPTLARSPAWGALLRHVNTTPGAFRKVRDEAGSDWLGSACPQKTPVMAKGGGKRRAK